MEADDESFLSKTNIDKRRLKRQQNKKETRVKQLLFLIGKKRKSIKKPSDIAKHSNELIKRNISDLNSIKTYFASQNMSASDNLARLYQLIVTSKILNGNIALSDTLTNKPLYFYYVVEGVEFRVFTNDALYIETFAYRQSALINGDTTSKALTKDLIDYCTEINQIHVVSLPFEVTGYINKGYYQDYSSDFAAIGMSTLKTEQEKQNILSLNVNKFTFKYKGIKYIASGNNNACVITKESEAGNVKTKYDAMKTFSVTTKPVLQEKTFEVFNKIRYIDVKLKPESFCPAFMILPENVNCTLLMKFAYDYNMLFQVLDKLYVRFNKAELMAPKNMMYWDTINECVDFLGIYGLTSKELTQEHKNLVMKFYNTYQDLKPVLMLWKQNQLDLQRILIDFYNSFTTKINFDKLNNVFIRLLEYIKNYEFLIEDESYNAVLNFLKSVNNFADYMYTQITNEKVITLVRKLESVLRRLCSMKDSDYENLLEPLREVGLSIYYLSAANTSESRALPCFPILLAPGAFLGDVYDNNKKYIDLLSLWLKDAKERADKKEISAEQIITNNLNFFNNLDSVLEKTVQNSVGSYLMRTKTNLDQNQQKDLVTLLLESFDTDDGKKLKKQVVEMMYRHFADRGTVLDFFLPDSMLTPIVNEYIDTLTSMQENKEINDQMNNLNNRKKKLMTTKEIQAEAYEAIKNSKGEEVDIETVSFNPTGESLIDTGEYVVYPVNEIIKDAIMNYSIDKTLLSKLKQYYIDLIYFSGYGKGPTSYSSKLNFYINNNLADLYNKYRLSDEQIAVVKREYKLPDIQQVLNGSKYYIREGARTFNYKISKKDAEKKIKNGKSIKVPFNIGQSIYNYKRGNRYQFNPIKDSDIYAFVS